MLLFFNYTPKCSHVNVVAQWGVIKPEASTGTKVTKLALMANLNFSLDIQTLNFVDTEGPFVNLLTGNSELKLPPQPPLPNSLTLFNQGWSCRRGLLHSVFLTRALLKITGDNRCGIRRHNISRHRSVHFGNMAPVCGIRS